MSALDQPPRVDPISKYYSDLQRAENWADRFFYVAAALSLAVVLVSQAENPRVYDVLQLMFVIAVAAVFGIGLLVRLHLKPAAEDARRLDLLSNSTQVPLIVEQSVGYYNNEQTDPIRKLGLNTLENSLFTKSIAAEMLFTERLKVGGYIAVFVICLLYRRTDLGILAAAAQGVLSEQILSKYIRLEWLRMRCDRVYAGLYALFQSAPAKPVMSARVLDAFTFYETTKANAAVALSSKIFEKRNGELSAEWDRVKAALGVR